MARRLHLPAQQGKEEVLDCLVASFKALAYYKTERMYALYINRRGMVVYHALVGEGNKDTVHFSPEALMCAMDLLGVKSVCLLHNHPDARTREVAKHSVTDYNTMTNIADKLRINGYTLSGSIVVSKKGIHHIGARGVLEWNREVPKRGNNV